MCNNQEVRRFDLSFDDPRVDTGYVYNDSKSTSNKPVLFSDEKGAVCKPSVGYEVENYRIIEKYKKQLAERGLYFPLFVTDGIQVDYEQSHGEYFKILTVPQYESYTVAGHFGELDFDHPATHFSAFFDALNTIGDVIPVSEFGYRDSQDEEGLDGVLNFARFSIAKAQISEEVVKAEEVTSLLQQSQLTIDTIPFQTAHKDGNPNNWRYIQLGDKSGTFMIDLEGLGLARKGWDAGRMYTHLTLRTDLQEIFLNVAQEKKYFSSHAELVYFWRVVMTRSLRELSFLNQGRYHPSMQALYEDSTQQNEFISLVRMSLINTLLQAKTNLSTLI